MKKFLRNGSSSLVHWRDYTDDKRKNPYRGIRGGLAPPSWYKIMTGPLGQHNIKTHRNRDCDDFVAPCIGVFFCFISKKWPTSEEPNVQMVTFLVASWRNAQLLMRKGSYPKVSCFCWKKLFILFFFWVPFVLGRFWTFQIPHSLKVVSFPGNAGSHWSDLNWPVVIRACHWEQPRGMRSMREFGGRSVVGIPWFLHLQAALTWKSTGPRRSVAFKMVSYHGFPLQLFVVDSLFYSKKCISLCLHSRSHDLLSSQGCREVLAR